MSAFFDFFIDMWYSLWDLLMFTVPGTGVKFGYIVITLLIIGFAINVYWKGAKT